MIRAVPTTTPMRQRQDKIFDLVYQIESRNAASEQRQQTVGVDSLSALMGMVGRFGFLTSYTPVGSQLRARLNDDMADQLLTTDAYGLPTNMLSFGVAELYFPERELRHVAPFYLAHKVATRIVGQQLPEDDRNAALLRFLHRVNLDEDLGVLIGRLGRYESDEGRAKALTDDIRARFRTLRARPLRDQLQAMRRIAEELETEIPDQVEETTETVWQQLQRGFVQAASELATAHGLVALSEVGKGFENFLTHRQTELQAVLEESTVARDELLQQKTEVEGQVAQIQELAFSASKQPSFWERLHGINPDAGGEVARLHLRQLATQQHQLEGDNALFQLEIAQYRATLELLRRLGEELTTLVTLLEQAKTHLDAIKAEVEPEIQRFLDLDFRFHVPVGVCCLRGGQFRQGDVDAFFDRLVIDANQAETVEAVVRNLQTEVGAFWTFGSAANLGEQIRNLVAARLRRDFLFWPEVQAHFSEAEWVERLRFCLRASAEYLLTDSAVNHENRSWIRILAAPQAAHEPLRQLLARMGCPTFFIVPTTDPNRISFVQVRVGVALHSIKSHSANRQAYQRYALKHGEERFHTRPEWRFLPDVAPIEDANDWRIGLYTLQGIVAGRLRYEAQSGSFWYSSSMGTKTSIGTDTDAVVNYLLTHQTLFHEVVSSFYLHFHQSGSVDGLLTRVDGVRKNPGAFAQLLNPQAFDVVHEQLEWLRKNYDHGT